MIQTIYGQKKTKYHSEKCNGYDSKKESRRADVLHLLEKQNIITNLREQVKYILTPAQYVLGFNGKQICARREYSYIADFVYNEGSKEVVEDVKGFRTSEYKKKKRLMLRIYGIEIKES